MVSDIEKEKRKYATGNYIAIHYSTNEKKWKESDQDYKSNYRLSNSKTVLIHKKHKKSLEEFLLDNSIEIKEYSNDELHFGWKIISNFPLTYSENKEYKLEEKSQISHRCPICSKEAMEKQPESGTHCFTINYECGTSIDFPISGEGHSFAKSCNEKEKPSLNSLFDNIRPRKLLNKIYIGEDLNDICRDINELWNTDLVKELPQKQGILKGKFEVSIIWKKY